MDRENILQLHRDIEEAIYSGQKFVFRVGDYPAFTDGQVIAAATAAFRFHHRRLSDIATNIRQR